MSYDFDYDELDPEPVHTRPAALKREERVPPGGGLIVAAGITAICVWFAHLLWDFFR